MCGRSQTFRKSNLFIRGFAPMGAAQSEQATVTEGQRPSSHRTAEPRKPLLSLDNNCDEISEYLKTRNNLGLGTRVFPAHLFCIEAACKTEIEDQDRPTHASVSVSLSFSNGESPKVSRLRKLPFKISSASRRREVGQDVGGVNTS